MAVELPAGPTAATEMTLPEALLIMSCMAFNSIPNKRLHNFEEVDVHDSYGLANRIDLYCWEHFGKQPPQLLDVAVQVFKRLEKPRA